MRILTLLSLSLVTILVSPPVTAQEWTPIALSSEIDRVAPFTGIVLWNTHEQAATDAIQLEFSYMLYNDVVDAEGEYNWSGVDTLLNEIASRGHQAILRFRFIYPGYAETAVPDSIKNLPDYREVVAKSEGKPTAFCDWSHPALQKFAVDFHTKFTERYDSDPRLAYVQAGFGLWAEYHIYDGPMELGKTFPSKAYQAEFLKHLDRVYVQTPWSISIDAAEEVRTPFAAQPTLKDLGFGVFDGSFMHTQHDDYNEACWNFFGRERWHHAPAGGEFSYYTPRDQETVLSPKGAHGEPFEAAAARFHISYMFGNDQPRHHTMPRIAEAGRATGYRFRISRLETNGTITRGTVENTGVAPIYHDTYPAIGAVRTETSLRGLLPGQAREFSIAAPGRADTFNLTSDRLVPGQVIPFEADLLK